MRHCAVVVTTMPSSRVMEWFVCGSLCSERLTKTDGCFNAVFVANKSNAPFHINSQTQKSPSSGAAGRNLWLFSNMQQARADDHVLA